MLRFLGIMVASAVVQTVLPLVALEASAQEASDYDSTCYLRIEGRGTQDLARLCGKNQAGTASTQSRPTTRSIQPAAIDPDDSTDADEPATPAQSPLPARSSIPSTRFPPTATPTVQPLPVAPRSTLPSPQPPTQAPSKVRLLPVPQLPALRPQATLNDATIPLKPRSLSPKAQVQTQTRSALKPQRLPPRSPVPTAPASPAKIFSLPASTSSQASPLEVLFQQLLQQKYLYLFWVFFLQVPLLKVAIDRRTRSTTPTRHVRAQTLPVERKQSIAATLAPEALVPLEVMSCVERASDAAIAHTIALPEPENITKAAEYQLSQANSQIAQIKVLLASAVRNRVSDIHLEPAIAGLRVRYRIDGILRDVTTLPLEVSRRTIVALKVMADMDISESRRPQDARLSEQYTSDAAANLDLDLRVSTLPCIGGEKAVIRLLPRQNPFSQMDELGFTEKALALYQGWLTQPQGMIIFTGPTGSGKTSTLYTSLQAIATEHVNVVTVEDPVEYILPNITQTQVNETAGMTFPAGLRAILRQDPDIIMVGEIRDGETAETAVRAALTGHLVLTTLHTNDAVGAIPRLKDVGPDPGLISDALLGVVAQRLVRRICPHCAELYTPTDADLNSLQLSQAEANSQAWRFGKGCSQCFHSGYLGREAMIELVNVDATIRQIIYDGSLTDLTTYLHEIKFDSFRKAAIAKVTTGITTIAEIRRVLPASKLAIDS